MRPADVALGVGAMLVHAAAIGISGCQVLFQATGDASGSLGELSSGQVAFGGRLSEVTFTINGNKVYDSSGSGCAWTPPNKVFQCDKGSSPTSGWGIDCHGTVSFNGQNTFYECDADDGRHDVYLDNGKGVNCKPIGLIADGCHKSCPSPSLSSPSPSSSLSSSSPPAPTGCPADLSGTYEYPHLIIPVDSSQPDKAAGWSYNGTVSGSVSSVFDFDVPISGKGKTCSLVFLFPNKDQLQTSSYNFGGDSGGLDFVRLDEAVTTSTTYGNLPKVKTDYGSIKVAPGHSYSVATFECPAGERVAFEIKSEGGMSLDYFQDYNPSPIGLYITVC